MANEEQLRILKGEEVNAWNRWRENNPGVQIDLGDAQLSDRLWVKKHLAVD